MFKPAKLIRQVDNFVMARWYHQQHQTIPLKAQDKLWPSSEEFYHPWNPVFADFCQSEEHLSYYPFILLKDGAQSLLDFFFRFPRPPKKSSNLLVYADLSFLVPKAWREKTSCYRLTPKREFRMTKKLLFYHLFTDLPLDKNSFSEKTQSWLSQFPKDAEVFVYWCLRENLYPRGWTERRDCFLMMQEFQYYFKNRVKVIEVEELRERASNPEWTYVNMDLHRSSISLCQIDNHMMANACQIWPRPAYKGFKGTKRESSPLSFRHDIVLYNFENKNEDFSRLQKLKDLANSSNPLPFPVIPELMELLEERLSC